MSFNPLRVGGHALMSERSPLDARQVAPPPARGGRRSRPRVRRSSDQGIVLLCVVAGSKKTPTPSSRSSRRRLGKLPAKNVADTVQRLPGVNISSNSGGDGAFADANRVSIRGTAPSLTQTLINGHSVGSADWFIANQGVNGGASGRSVSYDLLPAEIVGKVTVYKTSQADLIEGGASGSVDIETRSPLSLPNQLTLDGRNAAQHVDTQTDPQVKRPGRLEERREDLGVILSVLRRRPARRRNSSATTHDLAGRHRRRRRRARDRERNAAAPGRPDLRQQRQRNAAGDEHARKGRDGRSAQAHQPLRLDFNGFSSSPRPTRTRAWDERRP